MKQCVVAGFNDPARDLRSGRCRQLPLALHQPLPPLLQEAGPVDALLLGSTGHQQRRLALQQRLGTTDGKKVAATIKAGKWDTVLGPITYDKKGDITVVDYVVYQWDKSGNYAELPTKSGT